jgi:chorismate dehydratase
MVRVSAISFLNTVPLMRGYRRDVETVERGMEVWFTTPSECADQLRTGVADVGLIPAIEYQRIPDLSIVGDCAIATKGPVRSILLLSRKPLESVRTVAADTSSRTSVALTQILFQRRFGGATVQMVPHRPSPAAMLQKCDAALVIGDPALHYAKAELPGVTALDLGAEWVSLTGKPFVFAFWAARREFATPKLAATLQSWRDHGLAEMSQIVTEEAQGRYLSEEIVRTYLTENIHFTLDPDCLEGLRLYYQWAGELGLAPLGRDLDVVAAAPAAQDVTPELATEGALSR